MKRITGFVALALVIAGGCIDARADVANDFKCGPDRVQLEQTAAQEVRLVVNGKEGGLFISTIIDERGNYAHQFTDGSQLRVSDTGRIAFKAKESVWRSCKPLVLYHD